MKQLRFKFYLFVILCSEIVWSNATPRILTAELNPNLMNCTMDSCKSRTLVHIRAIGNEDEMHYIWNINEQPTILVALCNLNTSVSFEWNDDDETLATVKFSNEPKYTMSFVLTKIFAFNDTKDNASLIGIDETQIETIQTNEIEWTRESYTNSTNETSVTINGMNSELIGPNAKLKLKLNCFGSEAHDIQIPHLIHSINATQIDFEFINISMKSHFERLRIATEFVLIANESKTKPFNIHVEKNVDDEYAPGTFKMINILSPNALTATKGSYVQFRPISYTNKNRNSVTDVHLNEPVNILEPESYLNSSFASIFYEESLKNILVQSFNVSFGRRDDKFYKNTEYTTWTLVLGYGDVPSEHVSLLAIIFACIGLGIPLFIIIIGAVYLTIKRMRNC